ncbi:hypothetical protein EB796_016967 [Bugula neritina]|uniref:Uncharacterized protein n=1 Tax=Bugula neritina TaxID=10212 RepID=A0A7J7JFA3_BUGNE|nr:hypothetical protein EB796_016967 [Bugula neritina]
MAPVVEATEIIILCTTACNFLLYICFIFIYFSKSYIYIYILILYRERFRKSIYKHYASQVRIRLRFDTSVEGVHCMPLL